MVFARTVVGAHQSVSCFERRPCSRRCATHVPIARTRLRNAARVRWWPSLKAWKGGRPDYTSVMEERRNAPTRHEGSGADPVVTNMLRPAICKSGCKRGESEPRVSTVSGRAPRFVQNFDKNKVWGIVYKMPQPTHGERPLQGTSAPLREWAEFRPVCSRRLAPARRSHATLRGRQRQTSRQQSGKTVPPRAPRGHQLSLIHWINRWLFPRPLEFMPELDHATRRPSFLPGHPPTRHSAQPTGSRPRSTRRTLMQQWTDCLSNYAERDGKPRPVCTGMAPCVRLTRCCSCPLAEHSAQSRHCQSCKRFNQLSIWTECRAGLPPRTLVRPVGARLSGLNPSCRHGRGQGPRPKNDRFDSMADSPFATPAPIVGDAFDQVMSDVDVPIEAKADLKPLFVDAHRSGDPQQERHAVGAVLGGTDWGEAYFGRWRERFRAGGVYPYMWRVHAKPLTSDGLREPETIAQGLEYLRVTDMQRLLVALNAVPAKGRPKRRSEYVPLLVATGNTRAVVDAAMPAYWKAREKWYEDREKAKCALLAHTISMRAYFLRDRARRGETSKLRPLRSDCPVETAHAEKWVAGEIRGDPPFFPGDRTRLVVDRLP